VVRLLLREEEVNVVSVDHNGISALNVASYYGHTQVVKLLLEHPDGLKVICLLFFLLLPPFSFLLLLPLTPFHFLLFLTCFPHQALNLPRNDGVRPLYNAAKQGHLEVLLLLISAGAPVDSLRSDGVTPLSAAAQNGHLNIVRILAGAGADINRADGSGVTPLGSHFSFSSFVRSAHSVFFFFI
jgi:ankyrin repeat protein